jgi:hypothetical protein
VPFRTSSSHSRACHATGVVGIVSVFRFRGSEPRGGLQTLYEPTMINDLQKCLDGCSDKMRVEVKGGVSLDVKTVADLRSLLVWPSSLAVARSDTPTTSEVALCRYAVGCG